MPKLGNLIQDFLAVIGILFVFVQNSFPVSLSYCLDFHFLLIYSFWTFSLPNGLGHCSFTGLVSFFLHFFKVDNCCFALMESYFGQIGSKADLNSILEAGLIHYGNCG